MACNKCCWEGEGYERNLWDFITVGVTCICLSIERNDANVEDKGGGTYFILSAQIETDLVRGKELESFVRSVTKGLSQREAFEVVTSKFDYHYFDGSLYLISETAVSVCDGLAEVGIVHHDCRLNTFPRRGVN